MNFYVYDWRDHNDYVMMYGVAANSTHSEKVKVYGFNPYVYMELDEKKEYRKEDFAREIGCDVNNIEFEWKRKLYGAHLTEDFTVKEYPFFKVYGENYRNLRRLVQATRAKQKQLNVLGIHEYDSKIKPILQLCSTMGIPTNGWVTLQEYTTINNRERKMRIEDLSSADADAEKAINPKILSYDIEVASSNPNVFPNAMNIDHCIFMISCVFWRYSELDTTVKYLLTLGEPQGGIIDEDVIVEMYESETDLLDGFFSLICDEDPQVITGYNIFGFDSPYILDRFNLLKKTSYVKVGIGGEKCEEYKVTWSSKAYGEQNIRFLDIPGRIQIDMLTYAKREFKFNLYKLDYVASELLGAQKDPITVSDIFRAYHEGVLGEDRAILAEVGKYCVKDSVLVQGLFEKCNVWISVTEMSRICNIPISFVYTRGQQIKVLSQVYKYCCNNNIVATNPKKVTSGYEGATVIKPIPGLYKNIISFDFNSLYPTIIIAYNIDYTTLVRDPSVPDELCHVIEWEDSGEDGGERRSYRCRFLKEPPGVLPSIIKYLLSARKSVKKLMNAATGLMKIIYDKRQTNLKVSANSMYGAMGVALAEDGSNILSCPEGSMSVTSLGRKSLEKASATFERMGSKIIYGDSVTGETPVILLDTKTNIVEIRTIDSIISKWKPWAWKSYREFKCDDETLSHKQQAQTQFCIWTSHGWRKIRRVIRHKTEKILYNIYTDNIFRMTVTEDHSLLDADYKQLKPSKLKSDTQLLRLFPKFEPNRHEPPAITIFLKGKRYGSDMKVPSTDLLNASFAVRQCYVENFRVAYPNFRKSDVMDLDPVDFQKIYYIFRSVGKSLLKFLKRIHGMEHNGLRAVRIERKYSKYVYDLETEVGNFQAGIGDIIVKNTDSCYTYWPEVEEKDLEKHAMEVEQKINSEKIFPPPMYLAFENVCLKFLILGRKKYFYTVPGKSGIKTKGALLVRRDCSDYTRTSYKAIIEKAFAGCSFEEIISYVWKQMELCCTLAMDREKYIITNVVNGTGDYKIKPLSEDPKKRADRLKKLGANESNYHELSLPAHVQLAQRMRKRGVNVDVGERLAYVVTYACPTDPPEDRLFKKIEDPEYVKKHGDLIRIDYLYYIKTLVNPIDEVLSIIFKRPDEVEKCYVQRLKKYKCLRTIERSFNPQLFFV